MELTPIPTGFTRIRTDNPNNQQGNPSPPDSDENDAISKILSTVSKNGNNAQVAAYGAYIDRMASGPLKTALQHFRQDQPADFSAFVKALEKGDGNGATDALTHGIESGLDVNDAKPIARLLPSAVEQQGGGIIDGDHAEVFNEAVGANVL
ncbi:MAG: hypothetical protein ACTHKH_03360 [Trinickia sp.]|jgi:hypothetical protein